MAETGGFDTSFPTETDYFGSESDPLATFIEPPTTSDIPLTTSFDDFDFLYNAYTSFLATETEVPTPSAGAAIAEVSQFEDFEYTETEVPFPSSEFFTTTSAFQGSTIYVTVTASPEFSPATFNTRSLLRSSLATETGVQFPFRKNPFTSSTLQTSSIALTASPLESASFSTVTPAPNQHKSSSHSLKVVLPAILCPLLVLAGIIGAILFLRRRKRNTLKYPPAPIETIGVGTEVNPRDDGRG
ncbi:MAG: hypothetical protein MMC23_007144 [Stictis urceolatum]|nr:hypothetical protein [Stictis urceolata]